MKKEDLKKEFQTGEVITGDKMSSLIDEAYLSQEEAEKKADKTTVNEQVSELENEINSHKSNFSNPHGITAAQVGAYTKAETDTKLNTKADKDTTYTKDEIDKIYSSSDNDELLERISDLDEKISNILSSEAVNVKSFGAKGDGVNDDTESINEAIDFAYENKISNVLIPEGVYMIKAHVDHDDYVFYLSNEGGIQLKDNINLLMSPNTELKAITTDARAYNVIQSWGTKNNIISGGKILGTVGRHSEAPVPEGVKSECGYGISLNGSENIIIENVYIEKCWGDGIDLQGLKVDGKWTPNKKILVKDTVCNLNRRQGMSIELVDTLVVLNSKFTNTGVISYTAPGAGVDIEPWDLDNELPEEVFSRNILFNYCEFSGSVKEGLIVMGESVENVLIKNSTFSDNSITQALVHTGAKKVCFDKSTFKRTKSFGAGLSLDGTKEAVVQNCKFENGSFFLGEETMASSGGVYIYNNDFVYGTNGLQIREETFPIFVSEGFSTKVDFYKNNFEYKDKISSGQIVDLVIAGNKGVYRDNTILNTRRALVVKGNGNLFINNVIHNTLFDSILNEGNDNSFVKNTFSGTGGYNTIKSLPSVKKISVVDNLIFEKHLVPYPDGTYGMNQEAHKYNPSILLGAPGPEDGQYTGPNLSGDVSYICTNNKRVSSMPMLAKDVEIGKHIPREYVSFSDVVNFVMEKDGNAKKGDLFLDTEANDIFVCVEPSSIFEGRFIKPLWEKIGSETQEVSSTWKNITLLSGYKKTEDSPPMYKVMNSQVFFQGEFIVDNDTIGLSQIFTLPEELSIEKTKVLFALKVDKDEVEFSKLLLSDNKLFLLDYNKDKGGVISLDSISYLL